MKIMTLNTWGGIAGKEQLLSFFEKHKAEVDIFCLQEIWAAPYPDLENQDVGGKKLKNENIMVYGKDDITGVLDGHIAYFKPHYLDHYGLLMTVKKNINIIKEGDVFVHKYKEYIPDGDSGKHARNIQYVQIPFGTTTLTVINFHGLWNGGGKTDTVDRIDQSFNIIKFLTTCKGEVILLGDFNLLPHTESLVMIEDLGLRNLVKEYGVTSTRTSFYKKPERFADYILVSNGIQVKDFGVLPDEVSDHSPLFIEIE
jgi:endonuclease/exonuclease/phosphatase family metal-dependent hydrolase